MKRKNSRVSGFESSHYKSLFYGVMATQQILILFFQVRVLVEQQILLNMKKLFKYFTNYGIDLCDDKLPEYGGHTYWLCKLLKIEYLWIGFCKPKIGIYHDYYEGYHHCLYLGIFAISWGGRPYYTK